MTQDELWNTKYAEILDWIKNNQRNPSKHRIEEHNMLSWIKYNKKILKAGKMKENRTSAFNQLLVLMEENKHINQYI